jgi:hypothetical protein
VVKRTQHDRQDNPAPPWSVEERKPRTRRGFRCSLTSTGPLQRQIPVHGIQRLDDGGSSSLCRGHTYRGDHSSPRNETDRSPRRRLGGRRGVPVTSWRSRPRSGSHERYRAHVSSPPLVSPNNNAHQTGFLATVTVPAQNVLKFVAELEANLRISDK